MVNMKHCMFNNTLAALQECAEHLENTDLSELSEAEKDKAITLFHECKDFADMAEDHQVEVYG